jgi:hypothetical protein
MMATNAPRIGIARPARRSSRGPTVVRQGSENRARSHTGAPDRREGPLRGPLAVASGALEIAQLRRDQAAQDREGGNNG